MSVKNQEVVRDRMMSLTAMVNSLMVQVVTCASRGAINQNVGSEMRKKIEWMDLEIARTVEDTNG